MLMTEEKELKKFEKSKRHMQSLLKKYQESKSIEAKNEILSALEAAANQECIRIDIRKPSYWGQTENSKNKEWDRFVFLESKLKYLYSEKKERRWKYNELFEQVEVIFNNQDY